MTEPNKPAALALVVDDDELMRLLVREALESEGLRVEEAADGRAALEVFARAKPDIVLLDVNMPVMDGFECCGKLRAAPGGERVPVLILTGQDDDGSIERAYEAGATDFMPKPLHWKILAHRVRYLLRTSRSIEDLARSEASLAVAQELAHVGSWERRPETGELYWSGEIYRILGLDPKRDQPSFEKFLQRIPEEERAWLISAYAELQEKGGKYELEHHVVSPDGSLRAIYQRAEVFKDEHGRTVLIHGTLQDVTERKQIETRIRTLAYFDNLTGLPNRLQFKEHLGRAIRRAEREHSQLAVMFLDLDRFKQINDSLGHQVGDQLLKAVAVRINSCLRGGDEVGRNSDDGVSMARLGGDEFTVLLTGLAHAEDAAKVAQRVVAELARTYSIEGHELFVTASLGIATYPADGRDVDTLLKNADAAMYNAKDLGRNNYKFYSRELNERAVERLALERDLHRALERGELFLHYQPQVDVASGSVAGGEALLRWSHPQRGLVPPAAFIPLAEQTGLILPIGEWVLGQACRQATAWSAAGAGALKMWVNVSGIQFRDRRLVGAVKTALARSGLDPKRLVIEVTESIMMEDREATLAILRELKALGIGVAVDDFGTGYSSLAYLKRFPLDTLKIDGSFVRDLDAAAERDGAIVSAIIAMGESLGLGVLAEGVETRQQAARLHEMGCNVMQGFLFSRPVPAEEVPALVKSLGAVARASVAGKLALAAG